MVRSHFWVDGTTRDGALGILLCMLLTCQGILIEGWQGGMTEGLMLTQVH